MTPDESLRQHLAALLEGGYAHAPIRDVLPGWTPKLLGAKPDGIYHSAWELWEHIRIAQWDILRFSISSQHVSPDFPEGYWPQRQKPDDAAHWNRSRQQLEDDLAAMQRLVSDPANDLHARIPHGDGQTLLREALTLAAHNSYHLGQLMTLGRLLGIRK